MGQDIITVYVAGHFAIIPKPEMRDPRAKDLYHGDLVYPQIGELATMLILLDYPFLGPIMPRPPAWEANLELVFNMAVSERFGGTSKGR